ncbi:zincin-like metallopeptidase domain-containing protein [Archaeoglobus neptunius]|uniref:hypothetical protein n=1 Tax=Archaeoglobus neptunius TaxID=2798580 RepID=UPI001927D094|nr:hypothetical protein [Archaeoglobus neptunius]
MSADSGNRSTKNCQLTVNSKLKTNNGKSRREKVRNAINTVLDLIEREKLEYVALAVFRVNGNKPSDNWSFFNRMLMFAHGTTDARGFRQWQQVGRRVKKGAKAFHILVPVFKKVPVKRKEVTEKIEELREEHCRKRCVVEGSEVRGHCGQCWVADEILKLKEVEVFYVEKLVRFKAAPVFRKEDTEGEPLEEDKLQEQLKIPCEFHEIVEELGLKVRATPFDGRYYGWYSPHRKEIVLASPDLLVFLHELAHAVDDKLHELNGSKEEREVVAELSAAVIAYLLGYKANVKHVKYYLQNVSPQTVYRLLNRVERVVGYVVERTRRDHHTTNLNESVSATTPPARVVV